MKLLLFLALISTIIYACKGVQLECIENKVDMGLGAGYKTCYANSGATRIPRIKQCITESFKTLRIVKVANNGQQTVDRVALAEFSKTHNSQFASAVKVCLDENNKYSDMYAEAARTAQCIFGNLKKYC